MRFFFICVVVTVLPASARAWGVDFPGVSKYSYFSQITNRLRAPMSKDGLLNADGISFHDHSVFFDSCYADLFPFGRTANSNVLFGNVGLGYLLGPFTVYGVGGGVIDYRDSAHSFGKLILAAGFDWPPKSPLKIDLYTQMELDTHDGFNLEVGGHPIQWRWLASSVHISLHRGKARVFENRNRLAFLGVGWLENMELGARRMSFSLSRRSVALFMDSDESSSYELEGELAWLRVRGQSRDIWEARMMVFISTVGDGPRGESRPGFHFNVSYVSANSSVFEGFGAELGFGAKQIDTFLTQQLYFTVFYNYSAYFYRYPSLKWGLGLTGVF